MTDEEKTAFETLTQRFTKMETLYKIKCNEIAIKKAKITRLTKQRDEYKQRAEKAERTLFEMCNGIAKIVKQN